jgi:hypothetical protein
MKDRQKEREQKLRKLAADELTPQQKADFYYKMSKILVRELGRLKELSMMLNATPDSYLTNLDFREAAIHAMRLTEILIERSKPTHIAQELTDGSLHAERFYTVNLGNLPGLKRATINLGADYKPTREELQFNQRLYDHKTYTTPAIVDHGKYSLKDFIEKVLPSLKAKDPNLKIKNRGIQGYKPPEEFTGESKKIDPKLLEAIKKLEKEIGTDKTRRIMAFPDYPPVKDENVDLFFKGIKEGDFSELSHKLREDMKKQQHEPQEMESKEEPFK